MTRETQRTTPALARPAPPPPNVHPVGRHGLRRILCVTPLGLDGRGGIDRLYRYLRLLPVAGADDIEVRYLASRGEAPGVLWLLVFPWRLARFTATLATWRPDLVHINFANGGSLPRKLAMMRVAQLFGVPVVIHFHCVFPVGDVRGRTISGRMMMAICRAASHVVAIGASAERHFVDDAGIDPSRVHVIANGAPDIGADLVLPKRRAPVRILFAGQVGSRKGSSILVGALARLKDDPDWACTIAGDGDVEGCRALVQQAGLDARVRLTGWLSTEAVHDLMREADIVVLPSDREVMPMSLVEGAAAGAALLATPVGEVRDVVRDGETGFLIDRDPATLAARLRALLADRDLLARMQLASRKRYDRMFRLERFASAIGGLYRTILPR